MNRAEARVCGETRRGSEMSLGLWSHRSGAGGLGGGELGLQGLWSGPSPGWVLGGILARARRSAVLGWTEEAVVSEGRRELAEKRPASLRPGGAGWRGLDGAE